MSDRVWAVPLSGLRECRGASIPHGDLLQMLAAPDAPAQGTPSNTVLDELREERL